MTRVKICGLARAQDAELAIELGAHALGFVFEPSSPRCVAGKTDLLRWAQALGPFAPPRVAVFGPLGRRIPGFALSQAERFDDSVPDRLLVVRPRPEVRLEEELLRVTNDSPVAAVLDAYHPGMHGGTGTRVDLEWARSMRERLDLAGIPMVLAGGLTPDNVALAIREVRPYAVDVSSGIESAPGVKDPGRMRAFIQASFASE